jgi:urea transport system ATP-binding protein
MDQAQRIAEYKEYSPRASRLSEERFLLFLEGVTTIFDGFKALDIEALGIEHNELRVIIGPNGAGKTTLCDVVSGKTRPTTGYVFFDGADITHQTEEEIALRGIGRKFQTPTVFDSLTTYENMELALPGHFHLWPNFWRYNDSPAGAHVGDSRTCGACGCVRP